MSLLSIRGLAKRYGGTAIFEDVSLDVEPGEFVALVGDSGVGKSTLLNCIAGLDSWDAGSIAIGGKDLGSLTDKARTLLRREQIGFVFQAFHVLPHLDVGQNIGLPLMLLGRPMVDSQIGGMLEAVGLPGFAPRLPQTLSGGQLQRVAIARALIHQPGLILADEPTGNLDARTSQQVMDTLVAQSREHGATLLLVTHSQAAAARADRVLHLRSNGVEPAVAREPG